MPNSPDANITEIQNKSKSVLEEKGGQNLSFDIQEVAFGLKSLTIKFAWPEEKDTDIIEASLSSIKNVSSVKIEDYRRAFG